MTVKFFGKVPFGYKRNIKKLYSIALEHLGQTAVPFQVSVSFVSAEQIHQINLETRNVDRPTDVLSFPTVDNPTRAVLEYDDFVGAISPDTNECLLGDIIICNQVAIQQAKEYGHSHKREVCFLALHGLLHLLGFDHVEEQDEKQMTQTQKQILDKFGVKRD